MGNVKTWIKIVFLSVLILGMMSCAGPEEEDSAFRTYITILPEKKVSNTGPFELTVSGTGFDSGTQIYFDGKVMATTFVSSSRLTCTIPRNDTRLSKGRSLSGAGNLNAPGDRIAEVYVKTSKGEESQKKDFTLSANYDFLPPVVLADAGNQNFSDHAIILDESERLYVFWIGKEEQGGGRYKTRITMVYSDDKGETWSDPGVIVDRNYRNDFLQYMFCSVSKENRIHVVYGEHSTYWDTIDDKSPNKNLYYLRSADHGVSWSSPEVISTKFKALDMVASTNGVILLVGVNEWDYDVIGDGVYQLKDNNLLYCCVSTNNGNTWSNRIKVVNQKMLKGLDNASDNHQANLVMNPGNKRIHLVYMHRTFNYYYNFSQYSDNYGKTWSKPIQLISVPDRHETGYVYEFYQYPNLGIDNNGNLYATWNNRFTTNLSIAKSTNNGKSWKLLNTDTLYRLEDHPKLIIGSYGNVNLFGNAYIRSTDNGTTWSEQYQRWQHDFGKAVIDDSDTVYMVNIEDGAVNFFKSH